MDEEARLQLGGRLQQEAIRFQAEVEDWAYNGDLGDDPVETLKELITDHYDRLVNTVHEVI